MLHLSGRGTNNDFLIKTRDPLAITYNDQSPQENHHLAAAFRLMLRREYNFFEASMPQADSMLGPSACALSKSVGCCAESCLFGGPGPLQGSSNRSGASHRHEAPLQHLVSFSECLPTLNRERPGAPDKRNRQQQSIKPKQYIMGQALKGGQELGVAGAVGLACSLKSMGAC